jgi:two-component system, cell cycle sensor histidine kinase and response regulator CckA
MILVVDDESESRTLLTAILTAEGYTVHAADSGELALASLAVRRPDLILLDIRMPGIDGFEVSRRLNANVETRDIPRVFLSASADLPERLEGLRLGAVDFITKPFHREELLARARLHIELGQLRFHLEKEVAARTAELRESEQRFRAMADAAPVMIVVSGTDKSCTFLNRTWREFTGRNPEEEHGNVWLEVVHPEDFERRSSMFTAAFDARRSVDMEYRLRRANGDYRWVLDRSVPRFTPDGVFAGYIGSCIDITDLKQNQETMLATQKLESLGVMAAGVAHDFGNLLGSIFAEADLALSEIPPGTDGRENIERITSLASYATQIVRTLTDSAGGGIDSSALERLDLSALAEQMLGLLTSTISRRAVVRTELSRNLPAFRGSAAQIRQVIMNLLINASEALGGNQGFITIRTEGTHVSAESPANLPEGDYVCLMISDTGGGMSAEVRARIFDQFFTTKSLGRGLGLAAVRGIVQSHGGAIRVTSTPGAGSTFEVLLPCASRAEKTASA